jgi:hypothetical protein
VIVVVEQRLDLVELAYGGIVERCLTAKQPQLIQREPMIHFDGKGA